MKILLRHVDMKAILSLEPIFMLIGAMARDLQADFLPYLPRIFSTYSELVDNGALWRSPSSVIGKTWSCNPAQKRRRS